MSIPYFVPDTSPIFSYSPCVNCATKGSWQSAYTARGDGYDVTFHQATDWNVSVAFNVSASSIDFNTGATNSGGCDSTYSINETSFAPGCTINNLPKGAHRVVVQPDNAAETFQFFGVAGQLTLPNGDSYANTTFDDQSPSLLYSGAWTVIGPNGPVGSPPNTTVAGQYASNNGFFNKTASITTATGSMEMSFQGAGIYVYGMSSPDGGLAEVSIDGTLTSTLNLTNPWRAYSSLLYFQTNLNASEVHNFSIVNTTPGKQLVIDYALLTSESHSHSSSTSNLIKIIGTISGVSAFLLITGVLIYLYFLRRRGSRRNQAPYGFSTGISYRDGGKASSIDSWRKNAAGATPMTPSSASGSRSAGSGSGSFTAGAGRFAYPHPQGQHQRYPQQQQLARLGGSPMRSPPPEYPDYVPYRGPIEPRPLPSISDHSPRYAEPEYDPPAIAGSNPSAQGWLRAQAGSPAPSYTPTAMSHRTGRSEISARLGRGDRMDSMERTMNDGIYPPAPIPLRTPRSIAAGTDAIPIDSYYELHPETISPVSTESSLGLSGMTARAMGATRSFARLWSSREGAPSSFGMLATTPNGSNLDYNSSSNPTTSGLAHPHPRPPPVDSARHIPTYTLAGHFAQSPDQLVGSELNHTTVYNGPSTSSDLPQSTSCSTHPESPYTLRRGVSIKSVKTMRSFFSGLLFHTGGGPGSSPETPALPQPAARPDSDIFPNGLGYLSRANSTAGGASIFGRSPSRASRANTTTTGRSTHHINASANPNNNTATTTNPSRATSRATSKKMHRTTRHGPPTLRLDGLGLGLGTATHESGGGGAHNFFIELNPNSPMTLGASSRPGSELTPGSWRF